MLEQIQRKATKFIPGTSHFHHDYKQQLIALNLLPLLYYFEIAGIMFIVNSLKYPTNCFNILNYVDIQTSNTRLSDKVTLKHVRSCTHHQQHFYFNRIPRLWKKKTSIDLSLSLELKSTKFCGHISWTISILTVPVLFTFYACVGGALGSLLLCHNYPPISCQLFCSYTCTLPYFSIAGSTSLAFNTPFFFLLHFLLS